MELVLPPLHREAKVHDALMLLHEADNQGDQALIAGALRDIAVERAVRPQVCRLAGLVAAGQVAWAASFSVRSRAASTLPAASLTAVTSSTRRSWNISWMSRSVTGETAFPCLPRETINPSWRSRIMALRIGALLMP